MKIYSKNKINEINRRRFYCVNILQEVNKQSHELFKKCVTDEKSFLLIGDFGSISGSLDFVISELLNLDL